MRQNDTESDENIGDAAGCAKDFNAFYGIQWKPTNREEENDHKNVYGDLDLPSRCETDARTILMFTCSVMTASRLSRHIFVF